MKRIPFMSALAYAKRGEQVVYHVGSLMFDRLVGEDFQSVHATACAAWEAYEQKRVSLVQRKTVSHRFEYIAVKL